ncbi:Flavin monooxygenase FMO [Penicillium capsulatum]|uniref:Flavin monooxygenase FMO n=1 Tax=Penicillium capsulatum TaxID=69766 RepID=A0A9W9LM91_9EURO|nr:Flavin monooxygenase FMO [Penicillium capsulatum]KAJ6117482.1 Flavin monooxygenase FMO [Penicillium capsulatum]
MDIRRVAIIGAGPCGLGTAKYLIAENHFESITIFEQRGEPGGVWNYTGDKGIEVGPVPRTKPSKTPREPLESVFASPIYDSLETNIPNSMMQFCDAPFPVGAALFPAHSVVRDYLHEYAEELRPFIQFQSLVVDITLQKHARPEWTVTWRDLKTGRTSSGKFDALVVANGHHNDPYIPDLPGMVEWDRAYPGSIVHSASYRRAETFANKKVIVIGHSASGIDIAAQIATVSQHPLLISEKSPTTLSPEKAGTAKSVPEIRLVDPQRSRVQFVDGHEECNVDAIVFCTGYHFSLPFLSSLHNPIVTDGVRPHHLYRHMLYIPEPSLALVGLPQRIVPFPFSQAQGAWIARLFSGRLAFPSEQEMEEWILNWEARHGEGRSLNTLAFPLDAEYINALHDLSSQAVCREGLANGGQGKQPPFWGDKEKWTRERFPLIKKASQALGSRRSQVKTLAELGFDFEPSDTERNEERKAHL